MKLIPSLLILFLLIFLGGTHPAAAAPSIKLEKPPLSERWFGIYLDNERVGFFRQKISETSDGYRIESDSSVYLKVMGFSKEASVRETYLVAKNLGLRSFEIEQVINGGSSSLSGRVADTTLRVKSENKGKKKDHQIRFKGDIFPGAVLNIFVLMRDLTPGKSYKALTFDAEEIKVKEVRISVIGEEKTPDGRVAIKLRNNLYPFVNNDIWIDPQGNTLLESVRDGLVSVRAEDPKLLGDFVGGLAVSKRDLIYDFSMVRAEPPIKDVSRLSGLVIELSGWSDDLPPLQEGGQVAEKTGEGRLTIRTELPSRQLLHRWLPR